MTWFLAPCLKSKFKNIFFPKTIDFDQPLLRFWPTWTAQSFLGIRKLARYAKLCQLVLFPERHLSLASLLPCLALLSRLSHNEKWIYHWVHKRMETMYILNCTKPNVFLAVHKTHLKNLCNFFFFKGAGTFHSAGQSKEGSIGFCTSQHPIIMKLLPDHLWH